MRWLIVKDLQILRRSKLLVALLVAYPVLLAVLLGAALTAGPSKPKVAFANLAGTSRFKLGGRTLDPGTYTSKLFASVDPIRVRSRAEAIEKVRDGEALGAIVVPADAAQQLQSLLTLGGGPRPSIEVFYNAEDPVKRRYVESAIQARLADANAALSDAVLQEAARYLDLVVKGGHIDIPLAGKVSILGLRNAQAAIDATIAGLPADDPDRAALEQVSRFARLAADNLDLSKPILASIGSPVAVKATVVSGSTASLDTYAVAVAVTVVLLFVGLLLAAALLALEREEQTYDRLARLVSGSALIGEKVVVAALVSLAVALALTAGLAALAGSTPDGLAVLPAVALACAALGTALGALAREVRAASLLAVLLALPLAAAALVPSGAVSPGLHTALVAISAAFPVRPALRALTGEAPLVPALHLLALAAVYGTVARLGLRRF